MAAVDRTVGVLSKLFNVSLADKLLSHLEAMPRFQGYLALPASERIAVAVHLLHAIAQLHSLLDEPRVVRLITAIRRVPRPTTLALVDRINEALLQCLRKLPGSPAAAAAIVEIS